MQIDKRKYRDLPYSRSAAYGTHRNRTQSGRTPPGSCDYITKPFNVNILPFPLHNLVNNRILLQEKFSKQPQATHQILATNPLDKELVDKAMRVIEKHIDNVEFNVDILAHETGIAAQAVHQIKSHYRTDTLRVYSDCQAETRRHHAQRESGIQHLGNFRPGSDFHLPGNSANASKRNTT